MAITEMKQRKSYRLLWKFWLDVEKPEESTLADYCGQLKEQRQYTSTIRDALRLLRDLRQESLAVLFELFPWINTWLEERAHAIAEGMIKNKSEGDSSGGEGADIKALQASIERLEMALLQQHTNDALQMAKFGDDRNPRLLPPPTKQQGSKVVTPDLPDIESASVAPEKGKAYANFMHSLSGMSAAPAAAKPAPKRASKPKIAHPEPATTPQDTQLVATIDEAKPRQIAGAGVQFAAPQLDDLEVDF